jgi:hypothetical protein
MNTYKTDKKRARISARRLLLSLLVPAALLTRRIVVRREDSAEPKFLDSMTQKLLSSVPSATSTPWGLTLFFSVSLR